MGLEIRHAQHLDWQQLAILMPAIFPELTPDLIASYLCYMSQNMGVAMIGKKIIGFYLFDPAKTPRTAWLNYIGVDKNNHGNSIGSNLLRYFEKHAVSKGFAKVELHVRQENTGAQKFYEKNGYHFVETRPGAIDTNFLYAKNIATVSSAVHETTARPVKRSFIASILMRIKCKFFYKAYVVIPHAFGFGTHKKK